MWVIIGLAITALFIIIFFVLQKKHDKKIAQNEAEANLAEEVSEQINDESGNHIEKETELSDGSNSENKEEGRE